jgi:hypothetical protein
MAGANGQPALKRQRGKGMSMAGQREEGERQIIEMVGRVAAAAADAFSVEIEPPTRLIEYRNGRFLLLHVEGRRLVIDVTDEHVVDYPADPDVRQRVEAMVRERLAGEAAKGS